MKILITIFFILFSPFVFGQVYYCVEQDAIGFENDNGFTQTEYDELRFTVDIDFDNLYFKSEEVHIITDYEGHMCVNDFQNKYMQCMNGFGSSITINKKNLKFVYSMGLGYVFDNETSDDLVLSYGKCSLF